MNGYQNQMYQIKATVDLGTFFSDCKLNETTLWENTLEKRFMKEIIYADSCRKDYMVEKPEILGDGYGGEGFAYFYEFDNESFLDGIREMAKGHCMDLGIDDVFIWEASDNIAEGFVQYLFKTIPMENMEKHIINMDMAVNPYRKEIYVTAETDYSLEALFEQYKDSDFYKKCVDYFKELSKEEEETFEKEDIEEREA